MSRSNGNPHSDLPDDILEPFSDGDICSFTAEELACFEEVLPMLIKQPIGRGYGDRDEGPEEREE